MLKSLKHDISRKKLNNLLGKPLTYTASLSLIDDKRMCLDNVTYNRKLVADHVWMSTDSAVLKLNKGDELTFTGTAATYRDHRGTRKTGIKNCFDFEVVSDGIYVAKVDADNRRKRGKTKYK